MPVYEYDCASCGERFDKIVRMADADKVACPACGGRKARRLLSVIAGLGGSTPEPQPVCGGGACAACS